MVADDSPVSKPALSPRSDVTCDPSFRAGWRALLTDNGRVKIRPRLEQLNKLLGTISISRHTALPMLRRASTSPVVPVGRQLISLLIGSSLIGVAVALMVRAELGLTPYDVMSSAVSDRLSITLGQAGWFMAGVFFVVAAVFGRRPSIWGLGYILANGVAIDSAAGLLTTPDTVAGQWAFVVAAVVVLATGVSLVMYSGTTGGPFELLMLAGQDRGIDPLKIRYGLDIAVFAAGVTLGGSFGPATVFYALSFGLVLKLSTQALVDHGVGRQTRLISLREDAEQQQRQPVA